MKKIFLFPLAIFAIIGFFGLANKVSAACIYNVSFDVNPKTVQFDSKVTFTTKVTVTGNQSNLSGNPDCRDSIEKVDIKYFVTSAGEVSSQPFFGLNAITDYITVDLKNGQGQNAREYYLNNLFSSDGRDKNSGKPVYFPVDSGSFYVKVYDVGSFVKTNLRTSGAIPVIITAPLTEFISDNYSPKLGDTIKISLKYPPVKTWAGTININGQTLKEFSQTPYSLVVVTDNGFDDKKKNSLKVSIIDSDGKKVQLLNDGIISINVGIASDSPSDSSKDPGAGGNGGMQGQNDKTLYNPISGVDNLTDLLLKIMQGFLVIIGVWSVVFIVLGGFRLVMSQGNEEAVSAAKKTITWAVIGLVVALLSFSIVAIVQNLLGIDIKE